MNRILPFLFALAIALAGGIYSADLVTKEFEGFAALRIGQWVAYPQSGSDNADPYARAYYARTGQFVLGSAEGVAFIADDDATGDQLVANCDYVISGETPAARSWTLRITDERSNTIRNPSSQLAAIASENVLRDQDSGFSITVSNRTKSGNWLNPGDAGVRRLILTLYDTSVASTTGISEIEMPSIEKLGCHDG